MNTAMSLLRVGLASIGLALCPVLAVAQTLTPSQQLQEAVHLMEDKGDYPAAIKLFEDLTKGADRNLAARALLYLGLCYEKLGKEIARQKYQQLINDFADQPKIVAEARARLASMEVGGTSSGMVVRRVWTGPAVDKVSSVSPSGKLLSFMDAPTGALFVHDVATSQNRRLTKGGYETSELADYSVFSPDGTQLAYGWWDKDGVGSLRIVSVEGSEPRILYRNPEQSVIPAAWSKDSQNILALFFGKSPKYQMGLVSVADGSVRMLKKFGVHGPQTMRLSPDGRYVAYDMPQADDERKWDIHLVATDDSAEIPLVTHPADDAVMGWTPDGQQILFASDRTGTRDLWLLNVVDGRPGGQPELLQRDFGLGQPLGFTSTGAFYFQRLMAGLIDVTVVAVDSDTGKIVEQPSALPNRVVGSNRTPAWSRDGKYLAYLRDPRNSRWAHRSLAIRSMETGEERELKPEVKLNHLRISWAPDGSSILATGVNKDGSGIFRIDVESGTLTLVCRETGWTYFQAVWAPDGKTIFYRADSRVPWASYLRSRDAVTGQEKEVLRTGPGVPSLAHFDLSPDRRQIVFVGSDAADELQILKLVSADGGEPRELLTLPKPEYTLDVTFSADGRYVLFGKTRSDPQQYTSELWRVPVEGGESQNLGVVMSLMPHISCHPDGRLIALTGGQANYEVGVMENFLPPRKEGE